MASDVYNCNALNQDLVDDIKLKLPEEEALLDLADLFKVFGDSTRIKIISVLLETQMCVCDIANTIGMSHSAVSHQLRILRNTKIVKSRRKGKVVFYKLADDHVKKIFDQAYLHITHLKTK